MSKRFGYGLITKHVALDPEITADAKAVYMVLCAMADKSGFCNPVVKSIRACTGLSEYRFYNAMQNLRAKGIVTSEQSKEGTTFARNTYQLLDRPYLKMLGTETEADNPKDLGTGSTGNTQTARTLIDSDATPSYPTDLGIKQYQCLKIPNNKNNTRKNIYTLLGEKLTERRKQAGITKGKLSDSQTARMCVDGLLKSGFTVKELLDLADRFPAGRCYDSWWHFEKFCLSEREKG